MVVRGFKVAPAPPLVDIFVCVCARADVLSKALFFLFLNR